MPAGVVTAAASGAALAISLIVAIGAQNAFVLRHGITRDRVLPIVITCVACDWVLIAAGAAGFGSLVNAYPAITSVAAWGGAAFLVVYGGRSFLSALHPGALDADREGEGNDGAGVGAAVVSTLAVTLLNPHVYLDTVVLMGSVASQHTGVSRLAFVAGTYAASLAWFTTLGFGGRVLAPLFAKPRTWRLLDAVIGIIMWVIAVQLVVGQLG